MSDSETEENPADDSDQGGDGAPRDSESPQDDPRSRSAWFRRLNRVRKLGLPIMTLVLLGIIFVSFHSILLPFIFAVVIVYLMEPIVKRLSPRLPRWTAVILVYLTFFGVLTVSILVVVPRFVEEIVRFVQTVPETISDFRKDRLPGINEDLQTFLESYLPVDDRRTGIAPASSSVAEAVDEASRQSLAFGAAHRVVHEASDVELEMKLVRRSKPAKGPDVRTDEDAVGARDLGARAPPVEQEEEPVEYERVYRVVEKSSASIDVPERAEHGEWRQPGREEQPVARFVPSQDGGFELYLTERDVELERLDDNRWALRRAEPADRVEEPSGLEARSVLDLEATLNGMIEDAVSTSNEQIGSLIGYLQTLVVGIIHAFVSFVLTFMVAAFISIDLPSFKRFFRGLLPESYREGYEDLLERMDKGLAGVIRGQLLICLVNGTLTYIGLLILDIKFAVLLAVVAGVLSLIPIFGTIISTIPIVIIGMMDGFVTGLLALAWILGIHFIEANILNPQIIGTSAHIHPVIVIFALLAGESAFGLVGALLAVPVASILLTLFKFVRDRFFGRTPEESTQAAGS